mgnify:CR=1 FL=1
MPRAIGIQEFKERILTRSGGISSSNLYQFSIDAGEGGMRQYLADNNFTGTDTGDDIVNLNLLCNEIQLPGVTYSSHDLTQPKKGITQKMATSKVFNELDVSFYCDAESMPLVFFRSWQDYIMSGLENPQFAYSESNILAKYAHRAYAQRYYDQYTCDIKIIKLEKYGVPEPENEGDKKKDHDIGFIVNLAKAYPYTVSSIPYSAGPANLVKVTVGFYYEYSHLITA